MKERDRVIAEVNASMSFEGMPLTKGDISRLKDCYGKPQSYYKKQRQALVRKYSTKDLNESSRKL